MQPELGQKLRDARTILRKNQTAMAGLLKVTHATYSRWENGHVIPTPKHRAIIEKLIEIAARQQRGVNNAAT